MNITIIIYLFQTRVKMYDLVCNIIQSQWFLTSVYTTTLPYLAGWYLSMKPEDNFLRRLHPIKGLPRDFQKSERFANYNERTLGFMLVNNTFSTFTNTCPVFLWVLRTKASRYANNCFVTWHVMFVLQHFGNI